MDSLIQQNPGQLTGDELSVLRGEQALAEREPDKIVLAAEQLIRSDNPCYQVLGYQYAARASLMTRDLVDANSYFAKGLVNIGEHCWHDPAQQLQIHASYASSLQLAGNSAQAEQVLAKAFERWEMYSAGGYSGADMMFSRASLELVAGNHQRAGLLLQTMAARGWEPYGQVRKNPLFDGLQEQLFSGEYNLSRVVALYRDMQRDCDDVGLTKFGI